MLGEQFLLGLDPDAAVGRRDPALDHRLLLCSAEELPELPLRVGVDAYRRWSGRRLHLVGRRRRRQLGPSLEHAPERPALRRMPTIHPPFP